MHEVISTVSYVFMTGSIGVFFLAGARFLWKWGNSFEELKLPMPDKVMV